MQDRSEMISTGFQAEVPSPTPVFLDTLKGAKDCIIDMEHRTAICDHWHLKTRGDNKQKSVGRKP